MEVEGGRVEGWRCDVRTGIQRGIKKKLEQQQQKWCPCLLTGCVSTQPGLLHLLVKLRLEEIYSLEVSRKDWPVPLGAGESKSRKSKTQSREKMRPGGGGGERRRGRSINHATAVCDRAAPEKCAAWTSVSPAPRNSRGSDPLRNDLRSHLAAGTVNSQNSRLPQADPCGQDVLALWRRSL